MTYNPADEPTRFYNSPEWRKLSERIRKYDHYQCTLCKSSRRPLIVHHVKRLKDRPDLALKMYDPDTGERQLITVCKRCHEMLHPESLKEYQTKGNEIITEECWE